MKKILIFTLLFIAFSSTAFARYRSVDAVIFNPVTDGGKYVTIHESSTLPQWRFNAGFYLDYAREPLELRYVISNVRRPVVDDLLIAHAQGAVGFTDWFEVGLDLPVIGWETWYDPDVTVGTPAKETHTGLGDLKLEMKFRLLDIERYHIGLAVVPFVTFPTVTSGLASRADPTATITNGWRNGKFASNEYYTYGGKFVIEGDIANRVWLSGNVGYQVLKFRQYYTDVDAWVDDTLLVGGGAHVRINDSWRLIGEMYGETVAKPLNSNNPFSNAFQSQRQTPIEADVAVRYQPQNPPDIRGLTFTAGAGRGVTKGIGSPDLRVFFAASFRKPRIVELPPPPPPEEVEAKVTEKIIITQKIHFEFNKANIRPISFPILDDVVELLKKNPSIRKVEIGGHCDWIGSDAYNLKLSQKRAQAVVDYLVAKGVEPNRLTAKGYGESVPIADNNTTEGRAKNRRVEFTVLE